MKIKQGLESEYKDYIEKNSDPYSKAVVTCGETFGNFVDAGKTFDEAERGMLDTEDGSELTGAMMGFLMSSACHFHERGDEIKTWWNKRSGGEPDERGVNNPAIITIGENEQSKL